MLERDPKKRYNIHQISEHKWLREDDSAKTVALNNAKARIQKMQAKKRWKKVGKVVKGVVRMRRLVRKIKSTAAQQQEQSNENNIKNNNKNNNNNTEAEGADGEKQQVKKEECKDTSVVAAAAAMEAKNDNSEMNTLAATAARIAISADDVGKEKAKDDSTAVEGGD
ncbi:unnamed protein product, partial [marine sediment metagenome]